MNIINYCNSTLKKIMFVIHIFLIVIGNNCFGMGVLKKIQEQRLQQAAQAAEPVKSADQTVGQQRLQIVREKSLEHAEKNQEKDAGIDIRSLRVIEEQKRRNLFTQTEAYFEIPELRTLVTKTFHGLFEPVQHMDVISRIMVNEAKLRDTHWVFYHATSNAWMVPQDLYAALYNSKNPLAKVKSDDFTFLRFADQAGPLAKEFLVRELKKNGLVDDNGESRGLLLSCNFSLFGNAGFKSECTWNYFMHEKAHTVPEKENYEYILKKFGFGYEHVDELMKLTSLLRTYETTLLQIFVPKDDIDDIGYLAWATGIPAHQKSIDWVRASVKNRTFKGKAGKPAALWALAALKDKFKNEQEKNPLFKEMLEGIEKGDYSLDAFLKVYCNKPGEIPNLNTVQARLIFSNDVLLNPLSNVRIFRHTTIDQNKMAEYKRRLNEIVQKIIGVNR